MNVLPLKIIADNRRKKAEVALFCPVGDKNQLIEFLKVVRKLDYHDKIDYLFIYPRNFGIDPEDSIFDGLSITHIEETLPVGTSGAFFCGSYFLYQEGYIFIIISDIDAFPNSKNMLTVLLAKAKGKDKVIIPSSYSSSDRNYQREMANINQWSIIPRAIFEKVGFYTPYFFRGGEDFEFLERIKKENLLEVKDDIYVHHPRAGYSIFHKLNAKRKFYPYIAGLMKAHVFLPSNYFKYNLFFLIWYLYYSFFADVFSDSDLKKTINLVKDFSLFIPKENNNEWFEIKQIYQKANYPKTWLERFLITLKMILSLILTKKAVIYTDEVILKKSRINFILGLLKASLFIPFNLIKGVFDLFQAKKNAKKFPYPVKPENAPEAIKAYIQLIKENLENIK
jgi:hypothetical protein